MSKAWCNICEESIVFYGDEWRHVDPLRDLEHNPAPDIGLLNVRKA